VVNRKSASKLRSGAGRQPPDYALTMRRSTRTGARFIRRRGWGRWVTQGVPGTGLFWTEQVLPHPPVHAGHRFALFVVAAIVALLAVWLAASSLWRAGLQFV
jgi:hypothetical protein